MVATFAVLAGDFIICMVMQDGTGTTVTLSSVSANLSNIAGTPSAVTTLTGSPFNIGSPAAAKLNIFLCRATAGIAAAGSLWTLNSADGNDCWVSTYAFVDVNTGAALTDVLENGSAGTVGSDAATSITINDVGVTTLGADRLALNIIGVNDDNTIDSFTGETGGDWTLVNSVVDATGTDGAVGFQTATIASAGTIDGGSDTMAASDGWGVVGFALIPAAAAAPASLIYQPGTELAIPRSLYRR